MCNFKITMNYTFAHTCIYIYHDEETWRPRIEWPHICPERIRLRTHINRYHSSGSYDNEEFRVSQVWVNWQPRKRSHKVASINAGCLNWFSCLNSYVFSNWVWLRLVLREAYYWSTRYIDWKHVCIMLLCQMTWVKIILRL